MVFWWKTLLKWMIWGYLYFRKPTHVMVISHQVRVVRFYLSGHCWTSTVSARSGACGRGAAVPMSERMSEFWPHILILSCEMTRFLRFNASHGWFCHPTNLESPMSRCRVNKTCSFPYEYNDLLPKSDCPMQKHVQWPKWPTVLRIIFQCDLHFQAKKPGCSHHKSFASSLAFHLLLVHPLHWPHPQSSTRRGRGRCRCAHNPHDRHRSGQRLRSCSWPLKPYGPYAITCVIFEYN